jgi:hypothetical protein
MNNIPTQLTIPILPGTDTIVTVVITNTIALIMKGKDITGIMIIETMITGAMTAGKITEKNTAEIGNIS